MAARSLPELAAAVMRRRTSARAEEARSSVKRRTFSMPVPTCWPSTSSSSRSSEGSAEGPSCRTSTPSERWRARSGVAASQPAPGSSCTSGPSSSQHGERQVAGHGGVRGEVVLRGLRQLAVLARGEDGRARELERDDHVLERRAQEPCLLPLDREVAHQRDERAEEPIAAPVARAGHRRSRGRGGRERGAVFGRWSHELQPTALRAPARQPVGRHSSRAGGLSGRKRPASASRSRPLPAGVPAQLGRHDPRHGSELVRRRRPGGAEVEAAQDGVGEGQRHLVPDGAKHPVLERAGERTGPGKGRHRGSAGRRPAAEPADDEVHRALRDRARGRVLDPLEAHEAREAVLGLVIVQARPGRETRRAAPARDEPLVDEGGVPALDPGPGEGAGRLVEERHGVGGGRTGGLVRRADDRAPLPGHEEEEAALALRAHRAGHHRRAAQHDVAGAQERRGGTPEPAAREELVRPGPGRVDDHAGADLRGPPGERVAHRDPGDPAPAAQERDGLRVVRRGGARAGGGVEEADREPLGARRLRVVPEGGAGEAARLEAGHEAQRLGGGDGPRRGDAVARAAGPGCGRG